MNPHNESLVFMTVFTLVIIGFVFAFVKSGPARFVTAILLFLATLYGWVLLKQKVDREDFHAQMEAQSQYDRNRRAQIRGEEIPPGGVTEEQERQWMENRHPPTTPVQPPRSYVELGGLTTRIGHNTYIAQPSDRVALATPPPTLTDQNADILRKYGAK